MTEEITLTVDSEAARAYNSASPEERRKIDLLLNLSLREATSSKRPLKEIMAEIGENARSRGLTPEILQSILDEE